MTTGERLREAGRRLAGAVAPSANAWRGAAGGVFALGAILLALYLSTYFLQDFALQKLPAFVARTGTLVLFGALGLLVFKLIDSLARPYRLAVFLVSPFVVMAAAPGGPWQGVAFGAALILVASFIGAGVALLRQPRAAGQSRRSGLLALTTGTGGLLLGLYAIFSVKGPHNPLLEDYVLADRTLDLPNPGLPGDYGVLTLTYGSGTDIRRADYGPDANLVARTVDGSKLIDNWDGFSGWLRTSYWGFDATELPLQARVWYPEGTGPFPLVLVVHGNHSMEDFSDPGYGYLGQLFASRGIILASVDENFINSTISAWVDVMADRPGLEEENDARGWLLLQHFAQWRDWNNEVGHRFHGKVDMDRLALIGHSRGGEAVAIAAAFNDLARYPDDATLAFDFGFNLRGVIAIAPVDGQYRPRENGTPVRDVNYFTIHGSMDGDVQSFQGMSQYARVGFPGGSPDRFKASLYVTGANHGQFNTTWENLDTSIFRAWALDLGNIMDGEAQRDVARVFFGAFMEIVLRDRREYLPMFADVRRAANWLPQTYYISRFASARQLTLAGFEEDIDPQTTTLPGGRIETAHLSKWHETRVALKYGDADAYAAVFAWDRRFDPEPALVSLRLPAGWRGLDGDAVIHASISNAGIDTLPDDFEPGENAATGDDADDAPLDWTVRLTDSGGRSASLPLSHDEALYPLVRAIPRRASFLDDTDPEEVLYRHFEFPVADFMAVNPALDPATASLSFVFDRSDRGAIIVDDFSVSFPGAADEQ